ncbi:MAG TPA: asparagine synthase (glutamine-hydrolyzing) [Nitriliruptorales bacterium]|nr:asparagine synthase (glutamine-hydrolyzing) [Nitriliruptorales bacterium]
MCGIAGMLDPHPTRRAQDLPGIATRMAGALAHRGPDGSGVWSDRAVGVALAHRRLAILDPSPRGDQPMRSPGGRYTIVLNGEIYNFQELRVTLERGGWRFRGRSDTEVLLAAIVRWGLRGALERCNGMFAFALWDAAEKQLSLVRDRIGEKPLYYGRAGSAFVFGSELKALRTHPRFGGRIDPAALALFLQLTFIPAPRTIYQGVHKLAPGSILTVSADATVAADRYWSARDSLAQAVAVRRPIAPREAVEEVDRQLREAVRMRMSADVPLGAFLSGGVDSTAVVAAMQAEARHPVRTFTAAFSEVTHDEARHAEKIAAHLGTDHTTIRLTSAAAMDVIPRLPDLYDEPFADPSQLPTTAVAAAARQHVTVCLSGDGGDEVFGGYNRYTLAPAVWSRIRKVPRPLRIAAARALLIPPHRTWSAAGAVQALLPGDRQLRNAADKVEKLASMLPARHETALYRALMSHWQDPPLVLQDRPELPGLEEIGDLPAGDLAERMMAADLLTELPDCMLVKVDRASMSVGLEVRVPLLDPGLIAMAWQLPPSLRIHNGRSKHVLREVVARYVPRELFERPKMGFDPPIGAWLRGPLRDWAGDLLTPRRLADAGLNGAAIRRRWRAHLTGRRNWDYPLWCVLVFLSWHERHRATFA